MSVFLMLSACLSPTTQSTTLSPPAPVAPRGDVELSESVVEYDGDKLVHLAAGADTSGDGLNDLVFASVSSVWSFVGPPVSGALDDATTRWDHALMPHQIRDLGDSDGDGHSDVAVLIEINGPISRSILQTAAVVFSGADMSAPASVISDPDIGPVEGTYTYGMLCPGDVNGDSRTDIFIASSRAFDYDGGLYLFHGPLPSSLSFGQEDAVLVGADGERLASSLASGDLDGDGGVDLAVGFEYFDSGPVAHVVPADIDGMQPAESLSYASLVSTVPVDLTDDAADLDGDGYEDLLVQPYGSSSTWIAHGPFLGDLAVDSLLDGVEIGSPRVAGDVDADGIADLVGREEEALAVLWYGPFDALRSASEADATFLFGEGRLSALSGIGDTNGDGFDDIAIGSMDGEAAVYVVFGGER